MPDAETARVRLRELDELDRLHGEEENRERERHTLKELLKANPGREAADELEAEAHAESATTLRHLQTPDGIVPLADLEPRTPDERAAAASAVARLRREAVALELWERLGAFESELVARAFAAGARAQAERLAAAIGTASATAESAPLRRLNDRYARLPARARAGIAEEARRFAEASHDPPAALRLRAVVDVALELDERLRAHHVAEDVGESVADVEAELDLVDRLRRTIDDLETGIARLGRAVVGEEW